MQFVSSLLDIRSIDAEDARRRQLLNILLLGVAAIAVFALVAATLTILSSPQSEHGENLIMIGGSVFTLLGVGLLYLLNRRRAGWAAGALFLTLLTLVFAFADKPAEVAAGRSLFLFAIPILMASVLLFPAASFIAAVGAGIIVSVISVVSLDILPTMPAILGFFAVALVSWLSARSLQRALEDLRVTNRELDQRVIERTRDLAAALKRVQSESNKNQAILESIADGVIVFDHQGQAIVANPAITQFLNFPIEHIPGRDLSALMNGDVREADRNMMLGLLESDEPGRSGIKFDWGRKTVSVSVAAVRDGVGETTGTVMVMRDFTREAELDRMKSAFVSTASHELRTPLNAILGYSDMLQEGVYGELSDEQDGAIVRVVANTKRMLNLVNNLLDQAQIEAGQLKLRPSPVVIHELVDELEAIMGVLAEQKRLELVCSVDESAPDIVISDPQRLQQILVNLMGNAIKFTDTGSVRLRIYRTDAAHWALDVTDTGPGIPLEAQGFIFEAFRQVDDTVTRRHAGSGLGLSIVKQLVTLLGGEVSLISAVGRGSTFRIILPLTPIEEQHA
ncbi:MAG: PAS domain-containing protein [Chloroflexi bacterium]|nr:PAS domain-containing protein [Chloroflexota bacterium]